MKNTPGTDGPEMMKRHLSDKVHIMAPEEPLDYIREANEVYEPVAPITFINRTSFKYAKTAVLVYRDVYWIWMLMNRCVVLYVFNTPKQLPVPWSCTRRHISRFAVFSRPSRDIVAPYISSYIDSITGVEV